MSKKGYKKSVSYPTDDELKKYADDLYNKHVSDAEEQREWNSNSTQLRDIFDCMSSKSYFYNGMFEPMKTEGVRKPEGMSKLFHMSNVSARNPPIQLVPFKKAEWLRIAQSTMYVPTGRTVYQEAVLRGNAFIVANGYGSLDEYLTEIEGRLCLQGNLYIEENSQYPGRIEYSRHLANRNKNNMRSYARTDAALAMLAHRYKVDRAHVYGPGRTYGNIATLFVINQKYWSALERVGLTDGDTLDIGSTLLPIEFEAAWEIKWQSAAIYDAIFTQVF